MKTVKIDIEAIDIFRKATGLDIRSGNMVFLVGDGNFMHRMMVCDVISPDDDFKAFVADDGCRYGLHDLWVLKSNAELHREVKILNDRLNSIKELL